MSILKVEMKDYAGRKITFNELSKRAQRKLGRRTIERGMQILDEGAVNIRNSIIQGMRSSPSTGMLYYRRRGKKGKPIYHRASSPGNYPRVDGGGLVSSISIDRNTNTIEVGSRITKPAYPEWLEKGTDKMEARPWLQPSADPEKARIKKRMSMVLRRSAADFVRGDR